MTAQKIMNKQSASISVLIAIISSKLWNSKTAHCSLLTTLLAFPSRFFLSGSAFVSISKMQFMKTLFVSICIICVVTASAQVKKNNITKQPDKTVVLKNSKTSSVKTKVKSTNSRCVSAPSPTRKTTNIHSTPERRD